MVTTYIFRVEGMHCGSCALLIDDVLDDLVGVHAVQTRMRDGRTTVELDVSRTSADEVIAAITELGYRAEAISV